MNRTVKNVFVGSLLGVVVAGVGLFLSMLYQEGSFAAAMRIALAGPYFEVILGGAIAGLVASHFRLQRLPKPSSQQTPIFMALTAAIRVAVMGAVYGSIGGAITGVVFIVSMSLDPHSTAPITELPRAVAIYGFTLALIGAFIVGALGALWGAANNRGITQALQN